MKVLFISPTGYISPGLFETFAKTFQENGHSIVNNVDDATCVLFDAHSGLFGYDWEIIGKVVDRKLPIVFFDQFDYFTGCGYKNDWHKRFEEDKNSEWNVALREFMQEGLLKVYFIRKMSKTISYPNNFYPLELTQYTDHDFPITNQDELFSRSYDFCFIGNTATPRKNICEGLEQHFKCHFVLGQPRIEHNEWLNRHRQSKFFVECGGGGESGGGFGSERVYQLITISPMLRCRTEQLICNDFENIVDCVEVGDALGNLNSQDVAILQSVLNDKDWLYKIYLNGIEKMHKYFNADYRAKYVSSIIQSHL